MIEIPITQGDILSSFFKNTYDSCPQSYLQGIMGRGFSDSIVNPSYSIIQVAQYCYFDGDADVFLRDSTLALLEEQLQLPHIIMVPLSSSWERIFTADSSFQQSVRYAMDKPSTSEFSPELLTQYIQTQAYDPVYAKENETKAYKLLPIDRNLYDTLKSKNWSFDFVGNYDNYEHFQKYGMGFVLADKSGKHILSGASSYSSDNDCIELSLATNPNYEGHGFATITAARFILECIHTNRRPSWDAANQTSCHIAEKLGYHFEKEYHAYKRIERSTL